MSDKNDCIDSAIVKNAVTFPNVNECFIWVNVNNNISIILDDIKAGYFHEFRKWSDENRRP
jgi:hypothetical protein